MLRSVRIFGVVVHNNSSHRLKLLIFRLLCKTVEWIILYQFCSTLSMRNSSPINLHRIQMLYVQGLPKVWTLKKTFFSLSYNEKWKICWLEHKEQAILDYQTKFQPFTMNSHEMGGSFVRTFEGPRRATFFSLY